VILEEVGHEMRLIRSYELKIETKQEKRLTHLRECLKDILG
jgi:hypothetical protein